MVSDGIPIELSRALNFLSSASNTTRKTLHSRYQTNDSNILFSVPWTRVSGLEA